MINAVVIGVGGRMGSRIAHWIDQTEGIQIAGE